MAEFSKKLFISKRLINKKVCRNSVNFSDRFYKQNSKRAHIFQFGRILLYLYQIKSESRVSTKYFFISLSDFQLVECFRLVSRSQLFRGQRHFEYTEFPIIKLLLLHGRIIEASHLTMIQFLPAFRHVALNHREVALLIAIIVLLVEGY